jgi:hypothetical protein
VDESLSGLLPVTVRCLLLVELTWKASWRRCDLSWDGAKAYSALFICFDMILFLGKGRKMGWESRYHSTALLSDYIVSTLMYQTSEALETTSTGLARFQALTAMARIDPSKRCMQSPQEVLFLFSCGFVYSK